MMQVHDMEQGTPEWFAVRMGLATASKFATVMAKGRDGGASKTRREYLYKLAGEVITGEPMEHFSNHHMERGHEMEPEARRYYAFMHDVEPVQVGFITNGPKGCSPDSLIGNDGMLEIKTKLPHLMLAVLEADTFPAEHRAQCQGQLWVAEREWIDLNCYWPKMPPFIKRAYRDDAYIAEIAGAVDQFNDELATLVAKWSPDSVRVAA